MRRLRRTRAAAVAVAGLVVLSTALATVLPGTAVPPASGGPAPVAAVGPQAQKGVAFEATAPPWGLPADARPYIAAAGLSDLPGARGGYEVHLDIFDNRKRVQVPADIGDVVVRGSVTGTSPLFTDDTSGIVHVDAAGTSRFTLGQLFTEWGVPLSATQMGSFTAGGGSSLEAFVDGHVVDGSPADVALRPHDEVAVWFGPAARHPHVPAAYRFP